MGDIEVRRLIECRRPLVLAAWLAACAQMIWLSRIDILDWRWPDPDDPLRLVQVRDWLSGQSWFDVTQYRMNAPQGVLMHWSRLVDVPLAAVIVPLRPLVGEQNAELVAAIVVPLLTLGIITLLVGALAKRLLSGETALLATVATPFCPAAWVQLEPLRIDHHGWQTVAGVAAAVGVMDDRQKWGALVAAAAIAIWLNISVEGLPIAAAIGGIFGLRWIRDPSAGEALRYYLAGLAGFSILLFAGTHFPEAWTDPYCDVVSPPHLWAFGAAAAGSFIGVRREVGSLGLRVAILLVIAALAFVVLAAIDPACARGPFGQLDPLIRRFWYDRVREGLPLWRQPPAAVVTALAQPIAGLAGAILALKTGRIAAPERRVVDYILLLAAAMGATVLLMRGNSFAAVLSMPGAALLCMIALERARPIANAPGRVAATVGAVFLMFPAYIISLLFLVPAAQAKPRSAGAPATFLPYCPSSMELQRLSRLPLGEIAAPLDLGPAILALTPHTVVASGHHRNVSGMRDTMRLFLLPPEASVEMLRRRDVDYVVACRGMLELHTYAEASPNGLAAELLAGRIPAWLTPMKTLGSGRLQIWEVRKNLLGAVASAEPAATRTAPGPVGSAPAE